MTLRNCLAALAVFGLTISAVPARAADIGLYVVPKLSLGFQSLTDMEARGRNGGTASLDNGYDGTLGLGAAVGFDLYPHYMVPARLEVEYMHMGEAEESGTGRGLLGPDFSYKQKNQASSLFVNAYVDLHNSTAFTPYVGAGLGTAWIKSDGNLAEGLGSHTETNVAWNVGLGVAMELSYNTSLDFGYRYASFGTAKTGLNSVGHIESHMAMHQFNLGLRFTF